MKEWLKAQWVKLAAGCTVLLAGVLVFFAGRYRRNGEMDFAAAKRELELNTARGAVLEKQLQANHAKQVEVVSDILAEELALSAKQKAYNELTAADVVARLRAHGLLKP